jgi:hypothetical protein
MATLFFSYSHKDEALRDELEIHLAMLQRSGAIEAWHDRKIPAGDELDGAIDSKMECASVILLLVSPDFLASHYCYDVEVSKAMVLHEAGTARVIPVILRPCDWMNDTPFKNLLAAPKDGKPVTKWPDRDEAFLDVVKQIRSALKAAPRAPLSPAPAPGFHDPRATMAQVFGPRSSNLRVKKTFTDADRDRFMDDSFDFMARYFEGSLEELAKRQPGIETKFQRIDAHCFIAVIYRNGNAISRCLIRHGGRTAFGGGITYSHSDKGDRSSCNEVLNLEVGEQALSLKPRGLSSLMKGHDQRSHLSSEGAAELYWSMLMEPLQR